MTPEEVLAVADRVVGLAERGEQLEAVVTWSRETEVRAYQGEVEHFVSADSVGVGVRIIRDGKQGLAWAGVLDDGSLASCVSEARDNAGFGTPDEHAGLAEPDGIEPTTLDLYDERLASTSPEEKIRLAVELERLTLAGDPRMIGLESSDYADGIVSSAIASTTGVRNAGTETSAYAGAYGLADGDGDTLSGFGFTVGRAAEDLDIAGGGGGHRRAHAVPARCLEGRQSAAHRGTDPVRHVAVPVTGRRDALRRIGPAGPFALRRPGG